MVTIKEKTVTTMRLKADCPSHARTDVTSRGVTGIVDEPAARGGTDAGLMPTETLMASLMGCTNVITNRIAHGMGVEISDMAIDIVTQFDRRGVTLQEDVAVPFQEVNMHIKLKTNATEEQLAKIKDDLGKYCPIAKVIRAAGTPIHETWEVVS